MKWSDATFVEDQDQWWHGGITRSVFLYATGPVYLADVRADAGLADDLTTGTLDLRVVVGFPGARLEPGWTVEARLDGVAETAPRRGAEHRSARHAGWTRDDQRLLVARRRPAAAADERPPSGRGLHRRMAPPPTARRLAARAARTSSRGRPRTRASTGSTVALRAPDGAVAEDGRAAGRLPAGRDRRARPAHQRRAGSSSAGSTATTSTRTRAGSSPPIDARRPRRS